MGRRWGWVLGALALLATLATPVTAQAKRASAPCQVIGFSPNFVHDGIALCAYESVRNTGGLNYAEGPLQVYLTVDSGRSWRRQPGTGLPGQHSSRWPSLEQVVFSPLFTTDRSVYIWAAGVGFYRSTDLGATWTSAFLPMPGSRHALYGPPPLAPLVLSRATPVEGQTLKAAAFLHANGNVSATREPPGFWVNSGEDSLIQWPGFVPVAGTQGDQAFDVQFASTPDWPATPLFALSWQAMKSTDSFEHRMQVHRCTQAFVCTDLLASVPGFGGRLIVSPTYSQDTTLWLLHGRYFPEAVAVSTDGGLHWREWQGLTRMPERAGYISGFSVNPGSSRTITVRFTGLTATVDAEVYDYDDHEQDKVHKNAPGERIYRTTDGGAHWKLVSFTPNVGGKSSSRRATTPWNAPYGNYGSDTGGVWEFGSRMFTLAVNERRNSRGHWSHTDAGVWCSVDQGAHWSPNCSR